MTKRARVILIGAGVVLVLLVVGIVLRISQSRVYVSRAVINVELPPPEPAGIPQAVAFSPLSSPSPAASPGGEPTDRPPPLVGLSTGMLAWEQQLATAAAQSRNPTEKARKVFAMLPTLPEEALATAVEQAVDRLPDKDYDATVLPVVSNSKGDGQVLSVLFADLMERPDAITLPALLTIARDSEHPYSGPALDNLRLLLRADHGRDWAKWDAAIRERLSRGQAK